MSLSSFQSMFGLFQAHIGAYMQPAARTTEYEEFEHLQDPNDPTTVVTNFIKSPIGIGCASAATFITHFYASPSIIPILFGYVIPSRIFNNYTQMNPDVLIKRFSDYLFVSSHLFLTTSILELFAPLLLIKLCLVLHGYLLFLLGTDNSRLAQYRDMIKLCIIRCLKRILELKRKFE